MCLEIFLADFAVFRVFLGISRKYLNFAGLRPREISEALFMEEVQLVLFCFQALLLNCHNLFVNLF